MIYLDMFFLFLGTEAPKPGETPQQFPIEYFYLTKNMQIKSEFRIHTQTFYVDKLINYQKGMKLLISMGRDVSINAISNQPEDLGWIVKIWDFQSLVQSSNTLTLLKTLYFQAILMLERGDSQAALSRQNNNKLEDRHLEGKAAR